MEGIITKGIGGFYYVTTSDNRTYQCKARGLFRKDGIVPYVGDRVKIDPIDDLEGYITEILPRRNVFIRPPVANVDCFVITAAIRKPELNLYIVDKFLVMSEYQQTDIIICLNKTDLAREGEIERFQEIYSPIYPLVKACGKTGEGVDELLDLMKGKKCAFAGPSGAGKSTLLNRMHADIEMETGQVSEKTERGKHTTRHVEIFKLSDGTMVFDTPGFTSFQILESEEDELAFLYPEMRTFIGQCKYHNCRHVKEPECKIREAALEGLIPYSRYDSYLKQLNEIREMRKY